MANPTNEPKKVMTAEEVSQYLKIPLSTVYDLTKRGKLKGAKVGKHWRYFKDQIDRYLLGGKTPVSTPRERRESPRINCKLPAQLVAVVSAEPHPLQEGQILNLSEGGLLFEGLSTDGLLRTSDPVKASFALDGGEKVEAQGRIVHRLFETRPSYGIKFRDLPKEVKTQIRKYVG